MDRVSAGLISACCNYEPFLYYQPLKLIMCDSEDAFGKARVFGLCSNFAARFNIVSSPREVSDPCS